MDDPGRFSLNPGAVKESGSVITGLPKWIVSGQPYDTNTYAYDANGVLYKRTSGGTWSLIRSVSNSHGQGLGVYNDYLYYVQDTQVGRYGPLDGSPTFTDNWQTGLNSTATTGFAPVIAFGTSIYIGHGNSIAQWDGAVWTLAKLTVLSGHQVRAIAANKEFMIFGTWVGTAITASEEGFFYVWDGISSNYNRLVDLDGGCNALLNNKNRLLSVIGSRGWLFEGDAAPLRQNQNFGRLPYANYAEVYPGAMTNWRGVAYIGFAANTDSTDNIQGVYHWTNLSDKVVSSYPEGMNLSFTISTGQTSNVQIGALAGIGNNLFIGWQDNNGTTAYGIDKVAYNGLPYASGYIKTTFLDDKRPVDDKVNLVIKVSHLPLRAGESIQIAYSINRGSFQLSGPNSTIGSVITRLPTLNSRFKELQIKVILGATNTSPTCTSVGIYEDSNVEEQAY